MGLYQHMEKTPSEYGTRDYTEEESKLQEEWLKNNKVKKIIPRNSDEKIKDEKNYEVVRLK